MKTTWVKFGECLGYPVVDDPTPAGLFRVHIERHPMAKSTLAPLYIPGWGLPGDSKYLLPVYDIMHQIYREVFNPKVGSVDQIHGFMIDLMCLTHQNRGSGLQLDVMDFLWHELQWGLCHKKRLVFAPYIMHLICVCWSEEFGGDLLALPEIETVRHPVKALRIKQHEKPRDAVAAAAAAGGDART
jgi:hypothetical protein